MKFYAIGGYHEVGKNMSAIEVNGEVLILDMGASIQNLIDINNKGQSFESVAPQKLIEMGVIPNDSILAGKKVVGIVISHGHLDHVMALPKLAEKYNCPIMGTPYTMEIAKRVLSDSGAKNALKHVTVLNYGEVATVSKNFDVELIRITHSIPHSSLIAVTTKDGIVTFACDYKLDNHPTLGEAPDYHRLKQLSKEGIKLHVCETVNIYDESRTPSEKVAELMVHDAVNRAYDSSSAVIVTTFASHIARLNSIIKANRGRRKIVMLGRSLLNYVEPAEELGLINLKGIEVIGQANKIKATLAGVEKNPSGHLVICTGNQGEEDAVLSRIARGDYKFFLSKKDEVIFSSEIIPAPINQANRYVLEKMLKERGVRIIKDVHVSGHAMREDHRDLLRMLAPEQVIPCHGETERLASYARMAIDEGYSLGDTVHVLQDGKGIDI